MSNSFRKGLDRCIDDIRSGENIDLYISVAASVLLISLNIFGLIGKEFFPSVSLAIISIISYTLLGLRQAMRDLKDKINPPSMRPVFLSDFPAEFIEQLESAREVWFSGIHLNSVLTAYHDVIIRKLQKEGKVRFLLVDPDGHSAILATKRFAGEVSPDQESIRIKASLATIGKLKEMYPNNVDVKIIDFPIEYTTYFFSPKSKKPKIYVERATYKISGGIHKPKFVYDKNDGKWFNHIEAEIKLQWEDARNPF